MFPNLKFTFSRRYLRMLFCRCHLNSHRPVLSVSKSSGKSKIPDYPDSWLQEATLYVHWPYCERMCTFCNFNKYMSIGVDNERMQKCLLQETETLISFSGVKRIKSVFFGGGTPSLASPSMINALIQKVKSCAFMDRDAEITLECNPTHHATCRLSEFKDAGINRISCGLQTLSDVDLKLLGRTNTVQDSLKFLECARQLFPGRVSLDLLFGRPQQSAQCWKDELDHIIKLCDNHISLYQLTVENGTKLFQQVQRREVIMPSTETLAAMYETAVHELEACGLEQYEVANFAKKGAESRHNMSYWDGTQFIGVGPGAHGRFVSRSLNSKERCARIQVTQPNSWMRKVEQDGHATAQIVPQSIREVLEELLMTSLRTIRGINNERWCQLSNGTTLIQTFTDAC